MKIAFIEASRPRTGLAHEPWVDAAGRFAMPSVGLLSMASLASDDDEVRILDEKVTPVPDALDADVAAISFKTMDASHAYAMADRLRAGGVQVILGGVHASLLPEAAVVHSDAVVVGEGEAVLPRVLADLARGERGGIYRAPLPQAPLDRLPRQRVELLDTARYMLHASQAARGCSFHCEFCPTRAIFGDTYRIRDVDALLAEAEHMVKLDDKPVFYTENVFGAGDLPFIARLTRGLQERGIRFGVFCDWVALNPETVELLDASGCGLVCLNLTGRKEPQEIAALDAVSRAGIPIWGYFMFGFEEDQPDVFERALARVRQYGIVSATMTVLTPFPATPMGERLAREGRIFSHDLDTYDHVHVHFEPRHMTSDQLREGFAYVCRELGDTLRFEPAVRAFR